MLYIISTKNKSEKRGWSNLDIDRIDFQRFSIHKRSPS